MIKLLNKQILFKHNEDNSHSYRIPSMIKRTNGELMVVVDQRIHSQLDSPYSKINQVFKTSTDGIKFKKIKPIANLKSGKDVKIGLIDSIITEDEKQIIHMMVDLFPQNSGLMPIVETKNPLYKHQLITNNGDMLLFDLKNKTKVFLSRSSVESKLWFLYDEDKRIYKDYAAYLKFNDDTKTLAFDLYKKASALSDKKWEFIQSLFEVNVNNDENIKQQFTLPSGAFLAHFTIDKKNKVNFLGFINKFLDKKSTDKNALVFSPGKGLMLKNQKNKEKNGQMLIPLYESQYALPLRAYCAILDKDGKWQTSNFLNQNITNWLSETQLIESKNGTIYAFSRNKLKNCLAISVSKDSGHNWQDLEEIPFKQSNICFDELNTQIMHGVTYLSHKKDEYVFISLPKTQDRKHGKLFIVKNFDFKNMKEIYELTGENEPFGYSTLEIMNVVGNTVTLSVLYETVHKDGELSWVGFDKMDSIDSKTASEISYQLLEIDIKKLKI